MLQQSGMQLDNILNWDPGALPAGLYLARFHFAGAHSEATAIVQVGVLR